MTGETLYRAHRATAASMGIPLEPWEELDLLARAEWEHQAIEQVDRDFEPEEAER